MRSHLLSKGGINFDDKEPPPDPPHSTRSVTLYGRSVEVDIQIADLIERLRDRKKLTTGSCHKRLDERAYIGFYRPDGEWFASQLKKMGIECQDTPFDITVHATGEIIPGINVHFDPTAIDTICSKLP